MLNIVLGESVQENGTEYNLLITSNVQVGAGGSVIVARHRPGRSGRAEAAKQSSTAHSHGSARMPSRAGHSPKRAPQCRRAALSW